MQLLLVEDDADLGQAVQGHLQQAGHQVAWAQCLSAVVLEPQPDLLLLDLNLPDGDGLAALGRWRQEGRMFPVIVLTARDQVQDRIQGLLAGADDYLLKPFDLDELLARITAVSRRAPPAPERLHLDFAAHHAVCDGQPVVLTRMEWAVLSTLAGHRGRLYTRNEIEGRLEAEGLADGQSNSLEVIVSRLRKKLGADCIVTQRGLGYRLV